MNTATINNEAAERLLEELQRPAHEQEADIIGIREMLDEALAFERHATVQRIRARLNPGFHGEVFMLVGAENTSLIRTETILAILDAEAAR